MRARKEIEKLCAGMLSQRGKRKGAEKIDGNAGERDSQLAGIGKARERGGVEHRAEGGETQCAQAHAEIAQRGQMSQLVERGGGEHRRDDRGRRNGEREKKEKIKARADVDATPKR